MKLKPCFQIPAHPKCASTALLLLRVVVGLAFVMHGWGKMQNPMGWMGPEAPVPGFLQLLAALSEFGGGIAWILGLLTPLASLGIAITMAVATFMVGVVMQKPFVDPVGGPSFELPLTFFCVAILLLLVGPGRFSVDAKIFGQR